MQSKEFKSWLWGTLIFLSVLSLGVWAFRPRPVVVETASVQRMTFRETVRVDGRFRAKHQHTVRAFAEGDLSRIDLKVGDKLTKNQRIGILRWDHDQPVVSPADAVVIQVFRNSPGPIHRGDPIIELAEVGELEAVAEVLTADAVRMKPGQSVRISSWGGSQVLMGKVQKISQAGFTKISALGVEEERTEVMVELEGESRRVLPSLGHNFHVEMEVLISEVPGALTVPIGALFRSGEQWAVYRVEAGRSRLKWVDIGLRNEREAIVLGGVLEGDQVVLYPGDLIRDGTKVKR